MTHLSADLTPRRPGSEVTERHRHRLRGLELSLLGWLAHIKCHYERLLNMASQEIAKGPSPRIRVRRSIR